jgi:hypothetical protein
MIPLGALAALLSLAALAAAQSPTRPPSTGAAADGKPAEKSGLETAMEQALKNNPDLLVAAAKAREAEATLNRARLQVTQKVVAAYQAVEVAKATARVASAQVERLRELQRRVKGSVSADEVTKAERELAASRARQASAEADMNYLLGKSAAKLSRTGQVLRYQTLGVTYQPLGVTGVWGHRFSTDSFDPFSPSTALGKRKAVAIPAADKIRKTLDRRVSVTFTDLPARDVLKEILKLTEGLHIQASTKDPGWDEKITARLTNAPLGVVLQLLEDALPDHCVVVRSYGLLIARKGAAPAGAVSLEEFWQGGVKSDKPASKSPNKP